jgi:hypothetical protein
MNKLFTYIMDIDGGTYIAQVKARDMHESIAHWISSINNTPEVLDELGKETLFEIKTELANEDYQPIQIRDTQSVWHATLTTNLGLCTLHIIQTTPQK